jgi:hypothetical protein
MMSICFLRFCWFCPLHSVKPKVLAGCQLLTPVILATEEAEANSLQHPISKNPITKNWTGGVAQGKSPEFKP